MAKFGEDIKSILLDVERFLKISLKSVKLSGEATDRRDKLVADIAKIREEWPQLQPDKEDQEILKEAGSGDAGKGSSLKRNGSEGNLIDDNKVPEVAVSELTDPLKDGFLVKKSKGIIGRFMSNKGKQFCVLHGKTFYAFDKQSSKKPSWSRSLENHEAKAIPDANKKEFQFEINCPGVKPLVFAASGEDEMKEWVAAVNKVAGVEMHSSDDDDEYVEAPIEDNDDEDNWYEETDNKPQSQKAQPSKPLPSKPQQTHIVSESNDDDLYDDTAPVPAEDQDDEMYDDCAHPPVPPVSDKRTPIASDNTENAGDDDLYDDGISPAANDQDDDLYEAYDDIAASFQQREKIEEEPEPAPAPAPPPRKDAPLPVPPQQGTPTLPQRDVPKLPPRNQPEDHNIRTMGENLYENLFFGVWDCSGSNDSELDFSRGDILEIVSKKYGEKGWWVAKFNDKVGLVPHSYLSPAYKAI